MFTEDKSWNNMRFARPEDLKRVKYEKIKIFEDDWTEINLPNPPQNDSVEAELDYARVKKEVDNANAVDIEQYKNCDEDASYYVKQYMDENDLDYDEDTIEYIESQCVPIIRYYKNKFNRIRPYQLASLKNERLNSFNTETSSTPSYPSGHTVQPRVVAHFYGTKYPEHVDGLLKSADICGYGRIKAGLHFPSDFEAGTILSDKMMSYFKFDVIEEEAPLNVTGPAVSTDQPVVKRRKKKHYVDNRIFQILTRNDLKKVMAEGIMDDTLIKFDLDRGFDITLINNQTQELQVISYEIS